MGYFCSTCLSVSHISTLGAVTYPGRIRDILLYTNDVKCIEQNSKWYLQPKVIFRESSHQVYKSKLFLFHLKQVRVIQVDLV